MIVAPGGPAAYDARVARLRQQYAAIPAGAPVRLAKRTSNLFRPRARATTPGLDVAAFDGVICVDPQARTADVQGMTTYEHLVDATLAHGLTPLVVPQLKTITLGGAVTGLGIESASFRNGLPHESVLEMDILTGDGRVVTAGPQGEHRDLYRGFPNSYGTLGYALRLRIELEPVRPFVHVRHVRFGNLDELAGALVEVCESRSWRGEQADFVDGTVFGPDEAYLTIGSYADTAPYTSDYTGNEIYYRSIQTRHDDWLTIRDYLWRWDTDWFWCSRAFGAQNPAVRRWIPRRYLRSDVWWRLVALERRYGIKRRLDGRRGEPAKEDVIQDVEIPVGRLGEFLRFLDDDTGIRPVWICPLRQRDPDAAWDLYALDPRVLYVNVGFWSQVALGRGEADGTHNRRIESEVTRLGGRKSLYSTSFYPPEEFWATYNGDGYAVLKKTYDPDARLLDLYAKCVERR
jgi:FAD/FMN-containing dehydrogenase